MALNPPIRGRHLPAAKSCNPQMHSSPSQPLKEASLSICGAEPIRFLLFLDILPYHFLVDPNRAYIVSSRPQRPVLPSQAPQSRILIEQLQRALRRGGRPVPRQGQPDRQGNLRLDLPREEGPAPGLPLQPVLRRLAPALLVLHRIDPAIAGRGQDLLPGRAPLWRHHDA